MAALIDNLKSSKGHESAETLNEVVSQLWPNINSAGGKILKETLEPMFQSMLPAPLSSLRFTKLDLGTVPVRFSKLRVHKTENEGIKLDTDVEWEGDSDIDLSGTMGLQLGVEKIRLQGRLSILLCPLTNIMPLIGAAQFAFINRPQLELDFTGAAEIADCSLVEKLVHNTILDLIASMAVLPNRYLYKLDAANDYFKTYQHHLGVVQLTVERATGLEAPKSKGVMGLFQKIVKDVPDCYCKVAIGAEEWKTSTKDNTYEPEWDETHEFMMSDIEQLVKIEVEDKDLASHTDIGSASISIKHLLEAGGSQELALVNHKGEQTNVKVKIRARLYDFVEDLVPEPAGGGRGQICGLATVLVASAVGLSGGRDELQPSVRVSWADKEFRTPVVSYMPGVDIFNPSFDTAFDIPLTSEVLENPPESIRITLMNKDDEAGSAEVAFAKVLGAPGMTVEDSYDVGTGAGVRARICVHGVRQAGGQ